MNEQKPGFKDYFRYIFLHVPEQVSTGSVVGRGLIFILFFVWGWMFIVHPVDYEYMNGSFIHLPNLAFHEAGHVIFRPFGRFLMVLGGSLMQLIMPVTVIVSFLLTKRDAFAASIGLWWVGQNFMDIAPYVGDARDLRMPLLGGVTGRDVQDYHDWEYLLETTGLIRQDKLLAGMSHWFGALLMIVAFVWGGYILYRQYMVAREEA